LLSCRRDILLFYRLPVPLPPHFAYIHSGSPSTITSYHISTPCGLHMPQLRLPCHIYTKSGQHCNCAAHLLLRKNRQAPASGMNRKTAKNEKRRAGNCSEKKSDTLSAAVEAEHYRMKNARQHGACTGRARASIINPRAWRHSRRQILVQSAVRFSKKTLKTSHINRATSRHRGALCAHKRALRRHRHRRA